MNESVPVRLARSCYVTSSLGVADWSLADHEAVLGELSRRLCLIALPADLLEDADELSKLLPLRLWIA